jgi:hypothetical protein
VICAAMQYIGMEVTKPWCPEINVETRIQHQQKGSSELIQ